MIEILSPVLKAWGGGDSDRSKCRPVCATHILSQQRASKFKETYGKGQESERERREGETETEREREGGRERGERREERGERELLELLMM